MKIVCIDGFNSYLGKNFYNKYKKKYKIVRFKSDINNIKELENFISKKKISVFIRFAGLSRSNCEKNQKKCFRTNYEANRKRIAESRKRLTYKTYDAIKNASEIVDNRAIMYSAN